MSQIPERLVNMNVYGGPAANVFLGVATIDLPGFEAITESIAGAGIAGEYDSPVIGHFKSQALKVNFRTVTDAQLDLLQTTRQVLDVRGSVQLQDPMLGVLITQAWRVECTGQTKNLQLGKMEPGKVMGSDFDLECAVIRISRDGTPLIEIDKFNMIFKVRGVDQLAKVRQDVGGV